MLRRMAAQQPPGDGETPDHGEHGHHDDHHHDHEDEGLGARLKHALVPHSHDAVSVIQTAQESSAQGIRTA